MTKPHETPTHARLLPKTQKALEAAIINNNHIAETYESSNGKIKGAADMAIHHRSRALACQDKLDGIIERGLAQ